MFEKIKKIHFIGIGGAGMSGIAEVLLNLGYKISGSDIKKSETTEYLKKLGAKVYYGHSASNLTQADVVVTSTAIEKNNPEVLEAIRLKIPVIPRIEMLAEIARMKYTIAIAGTHGKTTTTSLVSLILTEGGLDPTIVIGGRLKNIASGAKLGNGKFLVAEADESDGSFLKLSPMISIITNIDDDHLDYYKTMKNLKTSFLEFINKVPFYGCTILCNEDKNIRSLIPFIKRRFITYGFNNNADYIIKNLKYNQGIVSFDIMKKNKKIGSIDWHVIGIHNILNATAAAICGIELGIRFSEIKKALQNFRGVGRRLETKYSKEGITIIDDYGHHPTEIQATIEAIKKYKHPKRLIVIFQPHRYTRTNLLYNKIAYSLKGADIIKLMEIYPAGEKPIGGVSSKLIFDTLKRLGKETVMFSDSKIQQLASELRRGDIVLTLGAGNVYKIGEALADILQNQ